MSRFEDTPGMFGVGVGSGTTCQIFCEFCNQTLNKGIDAEKIHSIADEGDSIIHTTFAGKQICDCCFKVIEEEIWRRRREIMSWFARRIAANKISIEQDERLIEQCQK